MSLTNGKSEVLTPTMALRWLKRDTIVQDSKHWEQSSIKTEDVLQQCWLDQHGNEKWVDIPIETP